METAVRKATRLEYRPPKEKHLHTLVSLTFQSPHLIDSMLGSLERRLKERSWIITYKVFVILHYLMREGNSERVTEVILHRPSLLDASRIKNKSSSPSNIQNIYLYRAYLDERVIAYRQLHRDYVKEIRNGQKRLRYLSVADGLLDETAALQRQMESVLKCKFNFSDGDPSISFAAYKMTIDDLLSLFQAINESVVNILEHYFEMNKKDATGSLKIYKKFAQQTELTIDYLNEAKRMQQELQMNIPSVKHAPLSLAAALEEYLAEIDNNQKKESSFQTQQQQQPFNTVSQQQTQPFSTASQQQMQPFSIASQQQTQPFSNVGQQQIQPFSNNQQQIQPFNNNNQEQMMDAAFSTINRRSTLPSRLSIAPYSPQNPFATLPTQPSQPLFTNQPLYHANTISSGNNPFRSMTQPSYSQQIPVAKPYNNNPFSSTVMTPPATPSQPLQPTGNPFLQPKQTGNAFF